MVTSKFKFISNEFFKLNKNHKELKKQVNHKKEFLDNEHLKLKEQYIEMSNRINGKFNH